MAGSQEIESHCSSKSSPISVIIPTLEEEKYIARMLKNLKRINPAVEVIVVDGGSHDGTVTIARQFTDKVYSFEKRLISAGRNYGALHANGSILMFLDADVTFPSDLVEKTLSVFKNGEVVGATCNVMPNRFNFGTAVFFRFYNMLLKALAKFNPHSRGEFFVARKSAFLQVKGFNESMACLEDHDLASRLSKVGKFVFIPDLTVYESLRRFDRLGFWRVVGTWIMDYVSFALRGKTVSRVWRPVR